MKPAGRPAGIGGCLVAIVLMVLAWVVVLGFGTLIFRLVT